MATLRPGMTDFHRRHTHTHGPSASHALLRRFSALVAGETVARVFGLGAVVVMARRLSPGTFGSVVFGTAMVNWFRILVDSGTEVIGVRDVAREPWRVRELLERILGLRLALSALASALFVMVALLLPATSTDREAGALFALILPVIAINLRWMVLGVERARAVAVGNVACQVVILLGVLYLVRGPDDVVWVPVAMAAGELAYAGIVTGAIRHGFGFPRPRIDLPAWGQALRAGLPLSVNNLARAALYSFDVLLIALVLSQVDVGLYGAAYKPAMFGAGVVGLLGVSFLASYASSHGADRASLVRLTVLGAIGAGSIAALLLSVVAIPLLSTIFGSSYAGGATALVILSWTIPVMATDMPYSNALIDADRQRTVMRNNIAAAGFNVVANLAAIPLFGINGAAAVTVLSFLVVLVLNSSCAVRLGLVEPFRTSFRYGASRALAVIVASAAKRDSL